MHSGAITFSRLAKVTYGEAAAAALPAAAERASANRVFIMASQSLVERGPEIAAIKDGPWSALCRPIFRHALPHPTGCRAGGGPRCQGSGGGHGRHCWRRVYYGRREGRHPGT